MEPQHRSALLRAAEKMERKDANFLAIVRQLLTAIGGDPDNVVQSAEDCVRKLKEQHAGFRKGATQEDARRRLQNARLRTPIPDDRIVGLTAKKLDLQEELGKQLSAIVPLAVKLACIDAELAEALKLRDKLEAGRELFAEKGVYPDTLNFIADLHNEYRVNHAHFAAMDADERLAIAKILRRKDDLEQPCC